MKKSISLLIVCLFFITGCSSFECSQKSSTSKRNTNTFATRVAKIPNVICDENIRFSPSCKDPNVLLDVYYTKDTKAPKPCLLFVHGGGWTFGDQKGFALFAAYAASRGYVAVSCTYRVMPEYEVKDCLEDVQRALLWLRKNAQTYGGDSSRIGIIGGSAGGHLSSLVATSGGNADLCKNVFDNLEDSKVQACVAMAAVTDLRNLPLARKLGFKGSDEEAWNLSAMKYVSKESPPTLLLHATKDKVVPLAHSEELVEAYKKSGAKFIDHKFYDFDKHAFWNVGINDTFRMTSWNDALSFFDKILKEKSEK